MAAVFPAVTATELTVPETLALIWFSVPPLSEASFSSAFWIWYSRAWSVSPVNVGSLAQGFQRGLGGLTLGHGGVVALGEHARKAVVLVLRAGAAFGSVDIGVHGVHQVIGGEIGDQILLRLSQPGLQDQQLVRSVRIRGDRRAVRQFELQYPLLGGLRLVKSHRDGVDAAVGGQERLARVAQRVGRVVERKRVDPLREAGVFKFGQGRERAREALLRGIVRELVRQLRRGELVPGGVERGKRVLKIDAAVELGIGRGLGGDGVVIARLRALQLAGVVRRADDRLLIVELELTELLLGRLDLGAVAVAEDEEHVARLDRLAGLDHDGADLARLGGFDLVDALRFHRARAAHLCRDAVRLDVLRRHLGQAAVHDGIGEKGQHKQHREENDRGVFDPFSVFRFAFHERRHAPFMWGIKALIRACHGFPLRGSCQRS